MQKSLKNINKMFSFHVQISRVISKYFIKIIILRNVIIFKDMAKKCRYKGLYIVYISDILYVPTIVM